MGNGLKRKAAVVLMAIAVLLAAASADMAAYARGPEYTAMQDVYYTKANCVVYAEPTYTSTILTTLDANLPVPVIGAYSNGWYRIDIGVICYVKMDSLTTAGAIGLPTQDDKQIADAQRTAAEMGYEFVYLKLNKEKIIEKDVFNSYIGKKVILYVKLDDEVGISFKMLYEDKVTHDIYLNFTKFESVSGTGDRTVELVFDGETELLGQLAIFQFKEGYDKSVTFFPVNMQTGSYVEMNTYYTEYSEFAYAPVTQVADMMIIEAEVAFSLSDTQRNIMSDHRMGIKYQSDDTTSYRNSISSRLRKDTEYVDYIY